MRYKIYEQGRDRMLAVCDAELVGKTFKEGELSVTASERFYGGEQITEKALLELLEDCTIGNLLGEKAVKAALKKRLIKKEHIIRVKGVPHAQFVRMLQR
ncbi:MAG: DUF424 family protein [Candidatus Diapherotrites archaeon]|nr:DUF424 family protein [Candidatus Diapherotrites archaeon]